MTAALPIKHKPFNLEHAKAGAPYATRDGSEVTILKWDSRQVGGYCLIGVYGPNDMPWAWRNDGVYGNGARNHLDLVMTPLGYIDGEPVFTGDQLQWNVETITAAPNWKPADLINCRWPAPAKVYPTFNGSLDMLAIEYNSRNEFAARLVAVANAALAHAIDAGQVLTAQDHMDALATIRAKLYRAERALTRAGFVDHGGDEWTPPIFGGQEAAYGFAGIGQVFGSVKMIDCLKAELDDAGKRRAERDMAIAKAVLDAAASCPFCEIPRHDHLAAIIAKVPA